MKNVLVIDDYKPVLESLSAYLGLFLGDCTIRVAENGKAAMDIIKTVPIDVILTDLEMPGMDGYELMEYTKANYPAIPVLVMTGSHSPEAEKRARSIGAAHYVVKPFDVDIMTNLIAAQLEPDRLVS
jgi:CheY-like chemotaxis protein